MKIYMQPIESMVWFNREGIPHPLRYRILTEDDAYKTIKINHVLFREEEKVAGNAAFSMSGRNKRCSKGIRTKI